MPILINIIVRIIATIFISGFTFLGLVQPAPSTSKPVNIESLPPQNGAEILQNLQENRSVNPIEKQFVKQKNAQINTGETTSKLPPKTSVDVLGINVPLPIIKAFSEESFSGNFKVAAKKAKNSIVNIFCLNKEGKLLNANTGSGILIDPKGVVLTNSHIAELFLFKNYPTKNFVDCSIRKSGSGTYKAEILYIPDKWIIANSKLIFQENPQGNGERDYALLLLTEDENGPISNQNFPYLNIDSNKNSVSINKQIFAAGFPGTIFTNSYFEKILNLTGDETYITNINTFDGQSPDVIETAETTVGQRGSSGGAITDSEGNLIALIDSVFGLGQKSKINALTTSYILRDFQNEKGITLSEFLAKDLQLESQSFAENKVPKMIETIIR